MRVLLMIVAVLVIAGCVGDNKSTDLPIKYTVRVGGCDDISRMNTIVYSGTVGDRFILTQWRTHNAVTVYYPMSSKFIALLEFSLEIIEVDSTHIV